MTRNKDRTAHAHARRSAISTSTSDRPPSILAGCAAQPFCPSFGCYYYNQIVSLKTLHRARFLHFAGSAALFLSIQSLIPTHRIDMIQGRSGDPRVLQETHAQILKPPVGCPSQNRFTILDRKLAQRRNR